MTLTHDAKAFRKWYMMLALAWVFVILHSVLNVFWAVQGPKSMVLLFASLPLPVLVKKGLLARLEQNGSESAIPPTRVQRLFILLGATLGIVVLSFLQIILSTINS